MATTTTNLGLTKPALSESADVGVINDNSDKIDVEAGKSRANLAATYSASSAYAVGAYCERGGNLYRCTTAIPSGGEAWNSGHWTQVAVTGEFTKVIDNLTSTSTSAALSANQGKVIKDQFDDFSSVESINTGITGVNAYKSGRNIILRGADLSISVSAGSYKKIIDLPSDIRPSVYTNAVGIAYNGNTREMCYCFITSNSLYASSDRAMTVTAFVIQYFV